MKFLAQHSTLVLFPLFFFITHGDVQENLILLRLKAHWRSTSALTSWNNSFPHCNWPGVHCSNGSVAQITLPNISIIQPIPSFICDLKNLTHLDLAYNNIPGDFPTPFYRCSSLQYLDLSENLFVGELPADIDKMSSQLTYLNLAYNNFTGDIPPSIGRLQSLRTLYLHANLFNGSFPAEIGNLSTLETLRLAYNPFGGQQIPSEFGNMTRLKYLWMAGTNLVGEIPETLGRLSELEHLDLACNYLNGSIPAAIWSLKKLQKLYLFQNNLSGEIHGTMMAPALTEIDVSMNKLTGSIPEEFGKLGNLTHLFMYYNQLSREIPKSISLLPDLYDIRLFNNQLDGVLPAELGKHSKLWNLEVSNNRISGSLPDGLCANRAFTALVVYNNNMTGEVPPSLANCYTLDAIMLYNNRFSGELPLQIWSAPVNLTTVIIHHNHFSGTLPDALPWNLTRMEINDNEFSGKIPSSAPRLLVFKASNNMFSGEIPARLTGMSKLLVLSLSGNQISGSIPADISTLQSLTVLDLSDNHISGGIPAALGWLPDLTTLDLSHNQLSGSIPSEIGKLNLNSLNLSYNQLSSEVPPQLQNGAYDQSFLDNPGLCSSKSIPNLNRCARKSDGRDNISVKLIIIFLVLGGVVFLMFIFVLGTMMCRRRSDGADVQSWRLTYFQKLDFDEEDIIRGLTDGTVIGSGGSGQVYKINLRNRANETVAVKKIWENRKLDSRVEKTFHAEVKILSSIQHANIVKLLCCISSEKSKLLVYEYMENGSLHQWLHEKQRRTRMMGDSGLVESLDWERRLKIAIDAARGLCYMHHDCSPPVIHRDVNSSNILLDSEFGAKIGDFGLARMRRRAGEPESASVIGGTFGYMAPEYASRAKISEKMDVYSFGVVLLELTTGRRAQDGGREHEGLAGWAARRLRENSRLIEMIDEELSEGLGYLEDIGAVFLLGVKCTMMNPSMRPSMKDVLNKLIQCDRLNQSNVRQWNTEVSPLLQMKRWSQHKSTSDAGEEDYSSRLVNLV